MGIEDAADSLKMVSVAAQGQWRGAPVAVKYTRFSMADPEALEAAVREAVLSKRMSHAHVVQTYAWTVLTAHDVGDAVRSSQQPGTRWGLGHWYKVHSMVSSHIHVGQTCAWILPSAQDLCAVRAPPSALCPSGIRDWTRHGLFCESQ